MRVAIVTLEAFNELDSFVASALLNRAPEVRASICCPSDTVTSMNGVSITAQAPLESAAEADAVLIGSGRRTLDYLEDRSFLARLRLDPTRQLIGAQCSGVLLLHRLGLLGDTAASDSVTTPRLQERGVHVIQAPLHVEGNVATAGGCLASQYLASWMLARMCGWPEAARVVHEVAPVGQKDDYVRRTAEVVTPALRA
ncbi:MAG: DJ-1/PfpI family protein [Nannocystales bacterium]